MDVVLCVAMGHGLPPSRAEIVQQGSAQKMRRSFHFFCLLISVSPPTGLHIYPRPSPRAYPPQLAPKAQAGDPGYAPGLGCFALRADAMSQKRCGWWFWRLLNLTNCRVKDPHERRSPTRTCLPICRANPSTQETIGKLPPPALAAARNVNLRSE